MGAFLSYSIVSGFVMLALYLAYRLFLARDNQHGFNRGVLLAIYGISFMAYPILQWMRKQNESYSFKSISIEDVLAQVGTGGVSESTPVWGIIMIWTFLAGMGVVATRTLVTWVQLVRLIRSGRKVRYEGYIMIVTEDERFAPFSWMRYVVIGSKDYESDRSAIAAHELKHIACHHWVDLLIAQIVCIVDWFNPASWLMREELMLVHEYQADMAVIDRGHDTQEYQMLLIRKAVGARFPSLANSLNHSKLKKRITMMYKAKSDAGRKWKALALVPALALALGVTGVPAVRAAISTIDTLNVSDGKGSENPSHGKTSVQRFKVVNLNNNDGKTTVVIKGEGLGNNLTVSGGTFTTCGKTYKAKSLNCDMTDGNATITAVFPFITEFDKVRMTLDINGHEIPFNLESFFDNASTEPLSQQSVSVKGNIASIDKRESVNVAKKNPQITVEKYEASATDMGKKDQATGVREMMIYLDGELIGQTEMNAMDPSKITTITVDKKNNAILITSTGAGKNQ